MKAGTLSGLLMILLLTGCASVSRNPVPEADYREVTVLGGANVRLWGDEHRENWIESFDEDIRNGVYDGIKHREHHYLLISGGGANGAYGAGLLTGWTKTGTRPEFTIVTGVSTGALTAPFAFLGSDYDDILSRLYTTTNSDSIFKRRGTLSFLNSDAVTDTAPLKAMIESFMNDDLLRAIAEEGRKGRRLYIGTTYLDAGRPVIWDITAMAATGHSEADDLIRQVLLASAAIPGIFPPVYIDVTTPDGRVFDEMHVDGGASTQFFFYPTDLAWTEVIDRLDVKEVPKVYIIRNGRLAPDFEPVEPRTLPILGRSVSSLIRTQSAGDVFRMWSLAQRDGLEVLMSYIPSDTSLPDTQEAFDPVFMTALYNLGLEKARNGTAFSNLDRIILNQ